MKPALLKTLPLLLCLILCICLSPSAWADAVASGTCGADGGNLTWMLSDDGELVIEGSGDMAWFGNGSPWRNYSNQVTKLTIGNGVTSISSCAFLHCNIETVVIPSSVVSIDWRSFGYCPKLTNVLISKSVASIEIEAFLGCENLSEIQVSPENPTYVAVDGVLYSSDMKTIVCCPCAKTDALLIPASVTRFEDYLPNNLTG